MAGLNRTIQEDSRQKALKHDAKHEWWESHGIPTIRCKLAYGDYALVPSRSVDTKMDLYELANDIDQQHERFRRELKGAMEAGCDLYVLVENKDGVTSLDTLCSWSETDGHLEMRKRKSGNKNARKIEGLRLAKACKTMEDRYGVKFMFCAPSESAEIITRILEEER